MNVGLDDRRVDPKSATILQLKIHGLLHNELIDGPQSLGSQAIKGAVEGIVFGDRLAAKIGEVAQV